MDRKIVYIGFNGDAPHTAIDSEGETLDIDISKSGEVLVYCSGSGGKRHIGKKMAIPYVKDYTDIWYDHRSVIIVDPKEYDNSVLVPLDIKPKKFNVADFFADVEETENGIAYCGVCDDYMEDVSSNLCRHLWPNDGTLYGTGDCENRNVYGESFAQLATFLDRLNGKIEKYGNTLSTKEMLRKTCENKSLSVSTSGDMFSTFTVEFDFKGGSWTLDADAFGEYSEEYNAIFPAMAWLLSLEPGEDVGYSEVVKWL